MIGSKARTAGQLPAIKLPKPIAPSREIFPDQLPIFSLGKNMLWTLKDAYEGVQVMGGVGSGKTSSTGQMIAKSFCRRNMGGLVLCAKPGEKDLWLRYAKETGRLDSVVVFDGSGRHRLNFLDYAAKRAEQFDARSVVTLFSTIMEAAAGGEGASGDNKVWESLAKELLTHTIAVLYSAYGRVTLAEMMRLIDTAPQTVEQGNQPEWRASSSFCFATILKLYNDPAVPLSAEDRRTHSGFFRERWARRHDKIRTSIEATFSSAAYPFQTGVLCELFCTHSTVVPEMAHEGAIFIIDLPIKTHGAAGIVAQHIWKYLFQKATEERKNTRSDKVRPVFLWADECQFFINSYDREFLGTARESKACTVFITQNLPTYYAAMSGRDPKNTVNALLGNLQTKVFHQNQDAETNQFASNIVGKDFVWMESYGTNAGRSTNEGTNEGWNAGFNTSYSTSGNGGGSFSSGASSGSSNGTSSGSGTNQGASRNISQQLHEQLMPNVFPTLRKGGGKQPPEIIFMQGGRTFSGATWLRCAVPQG